MKKLFNLKSFFKFISKNKFYTFVNVFGMSVSLMFVIIIAIYAKQELSVDGFHENRDRLYALSNGERLNTANKIGFRLLDRYPEIEKVCHMIKIARNTSQVGDYKYSADALFVDTTFFDMFSFPILRGNKYAPLEAINYAVITESFAQKAFGDTDPLGKHIKMNDSVTVIVNGVIADFKNSTIKKTDILLRTDNIRYFSEHLDSDGYSDATGAILFVMTHEGADIQARETEITDYFREFFWYYMHNPEKKVIFVPIDKMYFSEYTTSNQNLHKGDWTFVAILISVGIIILIFAIINYVNLTVAQTGFRAKEMAIRRLAGSSRKELFLRLIMESTLMTIISFIISIFLILLFIPTANQLLDTTIYLADAFTPGNIISCTGIILLIGCISGLLPASVISGSKAIDIVKGTFRKKTKMIFSKFFITFQNAITISLVAASITMVLQINHLINAPLGYNTTNVMDIEVWQLDNQETGRTLKNELEQLACINRIGISSGSPLKANNFWHMTYEGDPLVFFAIGADSICLAIRGFDIIHDNHLTDPDSYYLSESTYQRLGLDDNTTVLNTEYKHKIAGKIKDFQVGNITGDPYDILVRRMFPGDFYGSLTLEVQGDPIEAYQQIKKVYEDVTLLDFNSQYMDQQIVEQFSTQRRTAKIVTVFAFIAILISLLGLIAISTYFILQRSREVAVRKIFGSDNKQILIKLITTFLNYVLSAFIIATPVIWHIMRKWLSGYSYRIDLNPMIFITAGIFTIFLSFFTVFWQSYKAANSNPVESIKAE